MRERLRILVLLIALVLVSACGALGGTMADIELTDAQNNSNISAYIGDTIALKLNENPTTGYRWSIKHVDQALLSQQRDDYQSSSNAPGSGGTRVIVFRAAAAGTTTLELANERSWELSANDQRYQIVVNIRAR